MSRTDPPLDPSGIHLAPPLEQARTRRAATRTATTRTATMLGLLAGATLLAGCAVPNVASMSPNLPQRQPKAGATASAATTPSAHTVPAASATAAAADDGVSTSSESTMLPHNRGDLYRGSLTRKLTAGDRTLVVDYWTDADPTTLSAATSTVVQLSAHLEDGDTTHKVEVSRFLATADDGRTVATLSDDRGEFVVTPPYSYGTALTVKPGDPSATSVTLSIQFDLLVETTPGSGAFFRQTVLDTVHIALPATPRGTQS